MQLVVDVGNTETVIGLVAGASDLVASWRVSSVVPRTQDELDALVRVMTDRHAQELAHVERAVIASVVPSSTALWVDTLARLLQRPVITIDPATPLGIVLDVDEPMTVGADRIVNTLAAREMYGRDVIAVDLGTATTYDCISADGHFLGGVIAPGLSAGLEWLGRRTAKLPRVEMTPPDAVIGRRTEVCIQSGVFWSAVDGVDGLVRRIKDEWGRPDALVVATGGYATVLGPHLATVDEIEPFLTVYGLAMAGRVLADAPQ